MLETSVELPQRRSYETNPPVLMHISATGSIMNRDPSRICGPQNSANQPLFSQRCPDRQSGPLSAYSHIRPLFNGICLKQHYRDPTVSPTLFNPGTHSQTRMPFHGNTALFTCPTIPRYLGNSAVVGCILYLRLFASTPRLITFNDGRK